MCTENRRWKITKIAVDRKETVDGRKRKWEFRIVHNEELCGLLRSHSTVIIVKCKRLQWAEHVVGMETRNA
jgi:hypothetical protein